MMVFLLFLSFFENQNDLIHLTRTSGDLILQTRAGTLIMIPFSILQEDLRNLPLYAIGWKKPAQDACVVPRSYQGYPISGEYWYNGRKWVATLGGGVYPLKGAPPLTPLPLSVRECLNIPPYLLCATDKGLMKLEGDQVSFLSFPNSLPASHVTAITKTPQGLVVGFFSNGVVIRKNTGWSSLPLPKGKAQWIHCLYADGKSLWIGTEAGLFLYEKGKIRPGSFQGTPIMKIWEEAQHLWVAEKNCLHQKTNHGWKDLELPGRTVQDGTIWQGRLTVGSISGLLIWKKKEWRSLSLPLFDIPTRWITATLPHQGNLYLGTYDQGVGLVTPDKTIQWLAHNFWVNPQALTIVGDTLFVGTQNHGLVTLDLTTQAIQFWKEKDPRLNFPITAFYLHPPNLYAGSTQGLFQISLNFFGLDL